jgi:phosphoribosylaminoimidazole-succinocarboxamide synthase
MKLMYSGKTKDIYELDAETLRMVFSDRVTKNEQGQIDPGGNLRAEETVPGQAKACLIMSAAFFSEIQNKGVARTHMTAYDMNALTMDVSRANMFKPGLEWIGRWVCTGSFFRRYKMVPGAHDGMPMASPVYEITLKDDDAGDPLIDASALVALGIVKDWNSMSLLYDKNKSVMEAIEKMFRLKGLDLWDIKIEWGLDKNGDPILIDEISPGSCRAFKKGTKERVQGLELAQYFQ